MSLKHISFSFADITVEPVVFLYFFSGFLYLPNHQALLYEKSCLLQYNSSDFCNNIIFNETFKLEHALQVHEITRVTSTWILYTTLASSVPSLFMMLLVLNSVGDKLGRKFPILLPCIGQFILVLCELWNAKFMTAPLSFMLVGNIVHGLCGGYVGFLMGTYSYIGHIAKRGNKMVRMSIVESMVLFSGTAGIFVSGLMLEKEGFIFVFGTCSVLMFLSTLYTIIRIENVRHITQEESQKGFMMTLVLSCKSSFSCVTKKRAPNVVARLVMMVISISVVQFVTSGDMDINLLYLKENYNFSMSQFGYYRALSTFLRGLVLVTALPLVKKCTNVGNLPLVLVGLVSYALQNVMVGVAPSGWMIFLSTVVGMLAGLPSAGFRSTMSSLVDRDEQGRLFSIVAASETLMGSGATLVFNQLYPATVHLYPGLCYLLAAGVLMCIFLLVLITHQCIPVEPHQPLDDSLAEDTFLLNADNADLAAIMI